ncbi:magnesium/cobalt transporter CorA [Bacillus tianshenii]|nr:magnesium/cobalt transporter CorA [Bacillus tianshenii]
MIHTFAVTTDDEVLENIPLEELESEHVKWYWVDFAEPNEDETTYLATFFDFHPLAIEDCYHVLQRPKLDYYQKATFFVTHAVDQKTYEPSEIDFFLSERFIVSYHQEPRKEINKIRRRLTVSKDVRQKGPLHILYLMMDTMVDEYFPILYKIEDHLDEIENNTRSQSVQKLMEQLFDLRGDLLTLRRSIMPMRDLVYRMLHSHHLDQMRPFQEYFGDIYDHLLRLMEKVESDREMTADIRDNYLSMNSHRMNRIMMVLTVITVIFMPLTFIAGLYGMNFVYMPELQYHYGYFIVLGVMGIITAVLFLWFKHKGWFSDSM